MQVEIRERLRESYLVSQAHELEAAPEMMGCHDPVLDFIPMAAAAVGINVKDPATGLDADGGKDGQAVFVRSAMPCAGSVSTAGGMVFMEGRIAVSPASQPEGALDPAGGPAASAGLGEGKQPVGPALLRAARIGERG